MNFVATCTARKRLPIADGLSAHVLPTKSMQARFKEWTTRLANDNSPRASTLDLYCGNSWAIVREIHKRHSGELRGWVISAGRGLLPLDEAISSYAATFSPTEKDYVAAGVDGDSISQWWEFLCQHRRECGAKVSSLTTLAKTYPNEPILAAVSAEYFKATKNDLLAAREHLADPDLLVIVSSGTKAGGELAGNLVPSDARLEHVFGKSRMALNMRVAQMILEHFSTHRLRAKQIGKHLSELLDSLPPSEYPKRVSSTDEEVEAFLLKRLNSEPNPSYTRYLREYRATGRACEQRRFRALYRDLASTNQTQNA
jgi:hypothetical protein